MDALEKALLVAGLAQEKQAKDLAVLELKGLSALSDYFIIFNNGVLIRHNNKLSFYTLPEMKQLEFPGIR